jgi:hypothetical protein
MNRHEKTRPASGWHWLLVVPTVMPLLLPVYNRVDPKFAGIPFFYWYQMGCAVLATLVISVVYLATKGRD